MTRIGVPAVALAAVLAACSTAGTASPHATLEASPNSTATGTASAGPSDAGDRCARQRVTFELSFLANVQHAGYLVAARRDLYGDEGLDVSIKPGGPGVDVASDVADGTVDLGLVDYVDIARARASGLRIKAVAQTYKLPYVFWYADRKKGIRTIADWRGHTVGAIQAGPAGAPGTPERDAMLVAAGLDPADDVVVVDQDTGTADFLRGAVDVAEGFAFYHPAQLAGPDQKRWPDDFDVYYPAESGADLASQAVAASEAFLAKDPAAVRCFLRASIRGWRATFEDPQAAVDDVLPFIPENTFTSEHQHRAIGDVLDIVGSGVDDPTLLEPTPATYLATLDHLRSLGYLDRDVPFESTYDSGFYRAIAPVPAS
jgi:NitT/TauT family transport system substrate-binding protein